jgi:shikimate kinase
MKKSIENKGKLVIDRPIVLVGMMGAGKTSVGLRLAKALNLPFVDTDDEIEKAANMSVTEIFETHGEDYFRAGERRVLARLFQGDIALLATGGGAFMQEETRNLILQKAHTFWLRVPLDELVRRVKRKPNKRPLLKGGKVKQKLAALLEAREPIYELADIVINSTTDSHEDVVAMILDHFERSSESAESLQHVNSGLDKPASSA